jgi:hypothetical protein
MSKKSKKADTPEETAMYNKLLAQKEALEAEIESMEAELDSLYTEGATNYHADYVSLYTDDDEDGADEDFDLTDDDYGFIIRADGQIKALFMPTEYFDIPQTVLDILKTLGVGHPNDIMSHTVH